MGTRGAIGFITGEKEKLAYNHFDSYPSNLGVNTLAFLRGYAGRLDELREKAEALQVVDDETSPATPKQILALRKFSDFYVNQYSMAGPPGGVLPTENVAWYNLLHATQGDLEKTLQAGYIEDSSNFPLDSLFCEWAYVIDLDNEVLEVYQGFQERLPTAGRWAGRPTANEDARDYAEHLAYCKKNNREPYRPEVSEYKAVQMIALYPFSDLPSDEDFLRAVDPEDEAA